MWFIGVEVEQEGVHPLLRKNPGSAPGPCYYFSPESKQSIPVKQPSLPPPPKQNTLLTCSEAIILSTAWVHVSLIP